MLSTTTIASSISKPTESDSAIIVSMLSVKPRAAIRAKVAMIETGIAMAAIMVARQSRRKKNTMPIARMAPMTMVSCSSWTESSMKVDWSRTRFSL
ncbi:hypothetical protein D3C72_362520 [compost metagenome]